MVLACWLQHLCGRLQQITCPDRCNSLRTLGTCRRERIKQFSIKSFSRRLSSAVLEVQGSQRLRARVHLQVSQASAAARSAVEAAGGSVTTVYYNKLGALPP